MSNEKVVVKTKIYGGTSDALDSIASTSLTTNDIAFVYWKNIQFTYIYDSTDTSLEEPPYSVKPDDLSPTGAGLWILNMNSSLDGENLLINPEFNINQREYAADGVDTLANNEYGHDMWVNRTGSTQKYIIDGSGNIDLDSIELGQKNDSMLAADGKQVTLSIESGYVEVIGCGIASWTIITGADYGLSNSHTWVFDASDNGGFLEFRRLSPYTFKNPKLELGYVPTFFRRTNASLELLKCQRYFWTSGLIGEYDIRLETTRNTANIHNSTPFPVEMRAVPTCAGTLLDVDTSAASSVSSITASKKAITIITLDAAPGAGTFRFGIQATADASY